VSDRRAGPSDRWPQLGFGAGLRAEHYADVLRGPSSAPSAADSTPGDSRVDWFEAISENYMETGGRPLAVLEAVRRDYPVALHGVALSIGGTDPLDAVYLDALAALVERIEPAIVSDHLCWTSFAGRQLFDLLPLPLTEEVLEHVASRAREVQDRLGCRILLENPSTYLGWKCTDIPEAEFLTELALRADCGLLLDINNVHVTCTNMGLDPYGYIDAIAPECVGQIHLAGFEVMDGYLFDTHSRPVSDEVWALYRHALERIGPRTTMVEWDADIPSWSRLVEEVDRARRVEQTALLPCRTPVTSFEARYDISDPR
jgi:uncharacterized protein (UPF0276 family)